MPRELVIETARVFEPLLGPARYKGAWGGRGSGKSHFFAEKLIEDALCERGLRGVCIREVQKTLKESSKRLIEDKLQSFKLSEADGFKVFNEVIQTPGDGILTFQGMQDHNAESIKSLEGYHRAWVEEAQTLSARSLSLLRPTIREANSELWFSWNPRRKSDAVDSMLRGGALPTGAVVVKANWRDNPMFPAVLEQERLDCLRLTPEQYDHIWEGGYATVLEGAYYAAGIAEARQQGRIGAVSADPLMSLRAFVDIGGTGARADAFSMWVAQFIGMQVRVLDYYEAVGQPLAVHLAWMRSRGYDPGKLDVWLPHDGDTHDKVYDVSYAGALREAGYSVTVVPNQGKGAAKARVEAGRRLFPSIWFNEETTGAGLDALGWYHEKKDEARNIGLGPEHDWASHGCFHGDTKVLTRYGTHRIMNLPSFGEVLTPCGWKQYIHPRITKRAAPLVEVVFKSGYSVKCTPDHLFLTDAGWKSAESLTQNTVIRSTLTKSRSISAVVFTGFGLAKTIYRAAARNFTEMLGRLLMGPSQQTAIFITETGTSLTTDSKTLSVWTPANIAQFHGPQSQSQRVASTSTLTQEQSPLSGIDRQRGGYGIAGTRSAQRVGRSGSEKKNRASIVRSYIRLWFAKVATLVSIAAKRVRQRHTESELIESVRRLKETADVWDITVPDGHWFSLENGAVVHNSDAFGLMCVVHEPPQSSAPLKYPRLTTA